MNEPTPNRSVPLSEFSDVFRLRKIVEHLYDLLDDIGEVDDAARGDDKTYRRIVSGLQRKKNQSGVVSVDGIFLSVEDE